MYLIDFRSYSLKIQEIVTVGKKKEGKKTKNLNDIDVNASYQCCYVLSYLINQQGLEAFD